jgi:hypothetical protein
MNRFALISCADSGGRLASSATLGQVEMTFEASPYAIFPAMFLERRARAGTRDTTARIISF